MTLGENKKIALAIIEEYSTTSRTFTDDSDIATRLNFIYATDYQNLSETKKIIKSKVLKEIIGEVSSGYEEYTMPSNMYQFKRIIAVDEDGKEVEPVYYTIAKKIYISKESDAKYILEYYAYPTIITEETDDDFNLEIDQDAQMLLPWLVAKNILLTDPSTDHSLFMSEFTRRLQAFDSRKIVTSVRVKEGVL